jgi:hypothetical protein
LGCWAPTTDEVESARRIRVDEYIIMMLCGTNGRNQIGANIRTKRLKIERDEGLEDIAT